MQYLIQLGGADRDRTDDLVIANDTLFQLSYGPDNKKYASLAKKTQVNNLILCKFNSDVQPSK